MLRHPRFAVCAPVHTLPWPMAACLRRRRAEDGRHLCGTARTEVRSRVEWMLAEARLLSDPLAARDAPESP